MKKGIKRVLEDGWDDYVNEEFPPTGKISGRYGGYKTWQEDLLFHQFAAIGLDIEFHYKGNLYQFYHNENGVYLMLNDNDYKSSEWSSANEMISDFKLDGKPIYERFDELIGFDEF